MVLTLTIKHFIENEEWIFFLRNVDPFPELPQGQKKCFSSKVTVCGMFELRVRICFQKEKRYEQTSTFCHHTAITST